MILRVAGLFLVGAYGMQATQCACRLSILHFSCASPGQAEKLISSTLPNISARFTPPSAWISALTAIRLAFPAIFAHSLALFLGCRWAF
jgi:hypothetical protein